MNQFKICPYCKNKANVEAKYCGFCGCNISNVEPIISNNNQSNYYYSNNEPKPNPIGNQYSKMSLVIFIVSLVFLIIPFFLYLQWIISAVCIVLGIIDIVLNIERTKPTFSIFAIVFSIIQIIYLYNTGVFNIV